METNSESDNNSEYEFINVEELADDEGSEEFQHIRIENKSKIMFKYEIWCFYCLLSFVINDTLLCLSYDILFKRELLFKP